MDTTSTTQRPEVGFGATVLDTPDPRGLARFYADLLGWEVDPDDTSDDWVAIRGDGRELMFQLAPTNRPPTWPDGDIPQQFHLDLKTPDLDAAEAYALSLGAVRRKIPGEPSDSFRVFVDPSGHPLCLCKSD